MSIKLDNFGQKIINVALVIADSLSKKIWAGVHDSQNLAFATSHFVIELFPFDYLSNQKQ
jgi:hypothetical protein